MPHARFVSVERISIFYSRSLSTGMEGHCERFARKARSLLSCRGTAKTVSVIFNVRFACQL
jgi:hypothetical protein